MEIVEFSLILVCALVSLSNFIKGNSDDIDDFRKLTAPSRKICLANMNIPLEMVEDTEYGEFPEDERLKCYFKCVLEKTTMMDKTGKIKYNLMKKVLPKPFRALGSEIIDSCVHVTGNDNCDKAFKFMKCMFDVNPMAFIAP